MTATEILSRRAVAAWTDLGLDWLPGMLDLDGFRRVGDGVAWTGSGRGQVVAMRGTWHPPDLDDHATLGCIKHGMLPEAWPGCGIKVEHRAAWHRVTVTGIDENGGFFEAWTSGWLRGSRPAEGLVACLEAAAERRRQR